eukprot:GILK01004385.1.p1 GENE.GILK01004385.1~~GILK01004385.1.p1  ORF type:complete len:224 (-),score=32.61 GILK01004385.1:940-1611(-)
MSETQPEQVGQEEETSETEPPKKKQRKTQFRFNDPRDRLLAKAVLRHDPFSALHGKTAEVWNAVARDVHEDVDGKRCRERTLHLLEERQKNNSEALRKSGTVEEYEEFEVNLDEILELKENAADRRKMQKDKEERLDREGEKLREAAVKALGKRSARSPLNAAADNDRTDDVSVVDSTDTESVLSGTASDSSGLIKSPVPVLRSTRDKTFASMWQDSSNYQGM